MLLIFYFHHPHTPVCPLFDRNLSSIVREGPTGRMVRLLFRQTYIIQTRGIRRFSCHRDTYEDFLGGVRTRRVYIKGLRER